MELEDLMAKLDRMEDKLASMEGQHVVVLDTVKGVSGAVRDMRNKVAGLRFRLERIEGEVLEAVRKEVIKIELSDGQWANLKAGGKIVECTDSTIVTVKYRKRGKEG